jgi:hypothetical protein
MFALERVGRSGVRGSVGPHARERPHPRKRPGKDASRELGLDREPKAPGPAAAAAWRNGSFVFHMA